MTQETTPVDEPLAGVRMLDLARGSLGSVGRMLAELGAEVVRIEPRAGGADRGQGKTVGGVSLSFAAANLGKLGVALDLEDAADRETFEALAGGADILIETTRPGSAEEKALDAAGLAERHPGLVIVSISDFGRGAFAAWQATDPVLRALTSELSRSGVPGREPLLPPEGTGLQCAAAQAAFVTLVAYYNRLVNGHGDRLDFSLLDGATQALDPAFAVSGAAATGAPLHKLPRGRPDARLQYPIIACADGYVRICVLAKRQWQGMFEWMGRPEEFADPIYNGLLARYRSPTLIARIGELFADKTRAELEAAGQKYGVPTASVLTLQEALATDQVRAREATAPVEIAPGVSVRFPNGLMQIDGHRAGLKSSPPEIGGRADEIPEHPARPASTPRPAPGAERPLAGLKVLDLGVIVVGAEQSRLLGDLGAEVIKVETQAFPDGTRQNRNGYGMSPSFASGHRGKKSLGLNLRDPKGVELFLKLAEQSDVIFSNFKSGTVESLGLGPDVLLARNPRLIIVDSSAFGPTGPWAKRMGYGPLVRAASGLTLQWRYDDDPGSFSDAMTVYPDHVAGRVGVVGALALLIRRLRTGKGGTASVAQSEVMLNHMGAQIAAVTAAQAGLAVEGGPAHDAPWGVYPCAGEDEWCVVTVRDDADFKALCGVIGRPDLASDPALATAEGRDSQRGRLDQALTAWLAARGPREAMNALQAAGVPAGAMLRAIDLPDFAYYQDRDFFRLMNQPEIDWPINVERTPVRSTLLADPVLSPAPALGQHTRDVARERLGLDEGTIEALVEARVLEAPDA